MKTILITDGGYKNSLAIVRSLGKKKFKIIVVAEKEPVIAGSSKYCSKYYLINSNNILDYKNIIKKERIDLIIPVSYNSTKFFSENMSKFNDVLLPIIDFNKFIIAGDKSKTYKFAKKIDLNVPETYDIKNISDLKKIKKYPVVIKASEETGSVQYANSYEDLLGIYHKLLDRYSYHESLPVVQEYIPGKNGYGFYGFYWKGNLISYYMHERIHMYPETGGASTIARTFYDKKLFVQGKKILDSLNWHGVAMVEFKRHSKNGKYYLIEINPKYWGSLDLGISAGVNIPYYHILFAFNKKINITNKFKRVTFMWPEWDLIRALKSNYKLKNILIWTLNLLNPFIKKNWNLLDIKPLLKEVLFFIKKSKKNEEKESINN